MTEATRDYLILGAGPAGLQLASLMEANGDDYLVLERAAVPGSFFARYPRHRTLISINKPRTGSDDPELNLRLDWNSLLSDDPALRFTRYSERYFPHADDMVRYLADFATARNLKIRYNTEAVRVARADGVFRVTDQAGAVHTGRALIVATGVSRPYTAPIPGIELAENYADISTDPKDYRDQRVLIIGKGNSAFETADALMETTAVIHVAGPSPVRFAWRTHYVGHLRAINNNFLDTYQLKSANAVLDGTVRGIEKDADGFRVEFAFSRVNEVVKELRYDRVLACTGFAFDASVFAPECRPALAVRDRFPAQTAAFESVNVPGLFFAGTLSQERDFKKSTNGFIHGFRYTVRALHHIINQRYAEVPWPATPLAPAATPLTDAVIARVNRSSGLWQQFAVLADVITVDGDAAAYHEEVPVAFHAGGGLGRHAHGFVVTLEYGPDHDKVDPFDIEVSRIAQDSPGQAHDAAYLHPVIRHYRDGIPDGVYHLAENLENRWDRPDVHVAPLRAFIAAKLAATLAA